MIKRNLVEAKLARDKARTPYSNFKVGAALLMSDGIYIHGANIENASYGLCNCAERSALFSAYSQGYKKKDIKSLTVVADDTIPISPCGACRQVMHELIPLEAPIYLANLNDEIKTTSVLELLPYPFVLKDLDE